MIDERVIPVVLICDNNYVIPTCTAIESIVENKSERTILEINILTDKLTDINKEYFKQFQSETVKVLIFEADMKNLNNLHIWRKKGDYCAATETALLKFKIANILNHYDRIIYLDGDILCRKDLYGLYSTKLGDQYAAVVMDSGKLYSKRQLVLETRRYFNSGVMLLNLRKIREDGLEEKLIDTKRNLKDNSLMDQNVLNIVFNDNIKLLPIKYNYLYINLLRAQKNGWFEMEKLNEMFGSSYESLTDIRKEAVILHFSSKDKPWKFYDVPCAKEWYEYFLKSPVGNMHLDRKSVRVKELESELKKQKDENFRLKSEIKEIGIQNSENRYQLNEIWNSFSFKVGRMITFAPRTIREKIMPDYLWIREVKKMDMGIESKITEKTPEIIVSLTTYGNRIYTVDKTILSIMKQTKKPNRIQLYLSKEEITRKQLPSRLKVLERKGLEIYFCDDLKPHKKYYYAMKNNPEAIIITVDDDIIYDEDVVEKLYESYCLFPEDISAMRVHKMTFDADDGVCKYNNWKQRYKNKVLEPAYDLFPTGCGGVLYPPHSLHKDVFKKDKIKKLCLSGDDIWLKVMGLKNDRRVVLAAVKNGLQYIDGTQENGLHVQNVQNNENDLMINRVFQEYPEALKKILSDSER